jgi:hypothetical protein
VSGTTVQPGEREAWEDWTQQRPFPVTERFLNVEWSGNHNRDLACAFCDDRPQVSAIWRWVATTPGAPNFWVCSDCDSPDVRERFVERWVTVIAPILRRWGQ